MLDLLVEYLVFCSGLFGFFEEVEGVCGMAGW